MDVTELTDHHYDEESVRGRYESVSAKRSFSTVVMEKSCSLGATSFVDMLGCLGSASLLVTVVP